MEYFINSNQVYADLRSDFMFKKAFGQKNIMIHFLNAVLKTDRIIDIDYRNVENWGLSPEDRKVFYDVYCHTSDGNDIIVEMQKREQKYYRDRCIFYSSFPIHRQFLDAKSEFLLQVEDKSEKPPFIWDYRLHPVYVISILDFVMQHEPSWPQDKFHSYYKLQEVSCHECYSDILNFIFIELPRFNKVAEEVGDDIDRWMYLFKNMSKLQSVPKNFEKTWMSDLFDTAKIANFAPKERQKYMEDQKMLYDYQNCIDFAVEKAAKENLAKGLAEGLVKGEAKGIAKGKAEIAINMLKNNVPIEQVSLYTEMSESEINELLHR